MIYKVPKLTFIMCLLHMLIRLGEGSLKEMAIFVFIVSGSFAPLNSAVHKLLQGDPSTLQGDETPKVLAAPTVDWDRHKGKEPHRNSHISKGMVNIR